MRRHCVCANRRARTPRNTEGRLQGTVTDPTGAAIPGATLTLTDTVNGHTQTATSNATAFTT